MLKLGRKTSTTIAMAGLLGLWCWRSFHFVPVHSMGDTAISKYTLHQSPPDKYSWIEIHGFQQEKQHILHMVEFSLLCWLFLSVFVLHLPSWMTITKTPAQCHPQVRQLKVIYCASVVQSRESQAPKTGGVDLNQLNSNTKNQIQKKSLEPPQFQRKKYPGSVFVPVHWPTEGLIATRLLAFFISFHNFHAFEASNVPSVGHFGRGKCLTSYS